MDICLFSRVGEFQSYEITCTRSTSTLELFRNLCVPAIGRGEDLQTFLAGLKLAAHCQRLNSEWFNTVKLRSRIMKQFATPGSLASLLKVDTAVAALIQLIYAHAGLVNFSDDYKLVTTDQNMNKVGVPLSSTEVCKAISFAEFYRAVFHPSLQQLVDDVANAVEAGRSGPYIGSQAPQSIVTLVDAWELNMLEAARNGRDGRTFGYASLLDGVSRAFSWAAINGLQDNNKESAAVDAYALVQPQLSDVVSLANNYDLYTTVPNMRTLASSAALPGAISRWSFGLKILRELQIFAFQDVVSYCADFVPLEVKKVNGNNCLQTAVPLNLSGLRQVAEAIPAAYGFKCLATPEITTKLFGLATIEEKRLSDLLGAIEAIRLDQYEFVPERYTQAISALVPRVSVIPTTAMSAFIAHIGRITVEDGAFAYVLPYTVTAYSAYFALGVTRIKGEAVLHDINKAFLYAALVNGGLQPDLKARIPFGGDVKTIYSEEYANSAEGYRVLAKLSEYTYLMRTPNNLNDRRITEPGVLEPFGLHESSYSYYYDKRVASWMVAASETLNSDLDDPETLSSCDSALIEYAIEYAKKAMEVCGDMVTRHAYDEYGFPKPKDSPQLRRTRRHIIQVGAIEAYASLLAIMYPPTASLSLAAFKKGLAAAQADNIDILERY